MILRRARVKASTAKPGRANGKIIIRGFLNVNAPFSNLPDDLIANGFTALVDGAGMSAALTWTGSECDGQLGKSNRLTIRCVSADKRRKAIFRPGSGVLAPNVYKFRIGGKKLDFVPPLNTDPLSLIIDTSMFAPVDIIGEAGTCKVKGTQSNIVICKESGIFTVP